MKRSRPARIVASMLGAAILGACSPTVTGFAVAEGEPGEPLETVASLRANATSIQDVSVATASAGSGSFGTGQPLASDGNGTYSGQTEGRGPGDYEAQLVVRYRRLMLPGLRTLTRTVPYSLVWPAGTFGFEDGGLDLDGWTFQGVFVNGAPVPCAPGALATLLSRSDAGWPGPIGGPQGFSNGALRVLLAAPCFPASTASDAALWQFNLVSPDLTGRPEWQGIDGVSFRMIVSGMAVQAMATAVYEGEDGSDAYASPTSGGTLDFEDVSGTWTTVARTGYLPEGRPLRRILIRVFGEQAALASFGEPGTLLLDVVQPLP